MAKVKLLSSDLNGTLVHSHTMQEMIQWAFPNERGRLDEAARAFGLQTRGLMSMEETFRIAGRMSEGMPLASAIQYTMDGMRFVDGFGPFMNHLKRSSIHIAIVSTGYTVTLYAMRYLLSMKDLMFRCNRLVFADWTTGEEIHEEELEDLVRSYVERPHVRRDPLYTEIRATGTIELGLKDESAKASIAMDFAAELGVEIEALAHMGDTMGDSMGILEIARRGGMGIAFNYNEALEEFLRKFGEKEMREGRILLVCPKSEKSDLREVIPHLG